MKVVSTWHAGNDAAEPHLTSHVYKECYERTEDPATHFTEVRYMWKNAQDEAPRARHLTLVTST